MKRNDTRAPLRERNKQRIRQRIEEAAFTLFRREGYEHTTMDMIAEHAEVSRGTLFNYVSSKQALFLPFIANLYNHSVQPALLAALETRPTTQEALRILFLSIYEHILIYPDIRQGIHWEYFHTRPSEYHEQDGGTGFHITLLLIVQHGQQQQEIRQDLPAETLARYIGVLYISLLYQLINPDTTIDYNKEIEQLLTFLQAALH